ncbi:hypothetical protein O988_02066 [Pseudogymnoascus sp. VKM F-3808]|nr:hypothetical protein O988_02066 [Pseudogymnoascus sp. VKM F-3808]
MDSEESVPSATNDMYFDIGLLAPSPSSSSVYSENFTLEGLVERVDEAMQMSQRNTFNLLLDYNRLLQGELAFHRSVWQALMVLMDEVFDMALLLRGSYEDFDYLESAAKNYWLRYLDTYRATQGQAWI